MPSIDAKLLREALQAAERAADRARQEILPRFRNVAVETKRDGSPVTEADRAAERVIREELAAAYPEFGMLGEEYGADEGASGAPRWVVDPIDGTIAFSRGIPLFSTLIGLVVDDEAVLGLIDLPALDERITGTLGSACLHNGRPVRCSQATSFEGAIVSHGDPYCFERAGEQAAFERMAREIPMLRGYTDAFGHTLVLTGAVDAMVDLQNDPFETINLLAVGLTFEQLATYTSFVTELTELRGG